VVVGPWTIDDRSPGETVPDGVFMTFSRKLSVVALLSLAVAGCTAFPAQGPSAGTVVDSRSSAPSEKYPGYLVVDLDNRVASLLASRSDSSLRGRFGDHRPATTPVIGVGDAVSVTIWEASAGGLFSSPVMSTGAPGSRTATIPDQVVARDGSITVPYAGRIHVAGLTPPAVENRIVAALAGKAIEPQTLVTVSRNIANTVTVTGEVTSGARIPLSTRGDHILDVIAAAGGIRAPVHETFVNLTRDGRTATVPMQVLLARPEENIWMRAGDALTLVRDPQSFTAFGATGRNAVVTFDARGITLEEAVAKAGGLLDFQSDPSGVFLLRSEPASMVRQISPDYPIPTGQETVDVVYRVDLRNLNTFFAARKVPVANKDMLYVASAPLTDVQKFLSIVQTAASPIATGKTLSQ
jgi:polysaccharide export outer membrane protein